MPSWLLPITDMSLASAPPCLQAVPTAFGGHAIWWQVETASAQEALELLPFYVAERATATKVSEVEIPRQQSRR